MNVGMPQYGMPSGASSGAPYFNGWSPYGGFAQPQQGYGMSSPFGGFGGGYGMPSPFGGFGGGYGQPFQQMPMGGGKGGYSSPFGQFQTPNFAAKGSTTQPQSPTSNMSGTGPAAVPNPSGGVNALPPSNTIRDTQGNIVSAWDPNAQHPIKLDSGTIPSSPASPLQSPLTNMNQLPPGSSLPPGYQHLTNQIAPGVTTGVYYSPGSIGQIPTQSTAPQGNGAPPNLGGGNYGQNPFGGPIRSPAPHGTGAPQIPGSLPPQNPIPPAGSIPGYGGTAPGTPQPLIGGATPPYFNPASPPISSPAQPAPIPQAVPPQMMSPVSGPAQMLPQQMFNQTRIPGANSVLPGRNMLVGGYR